MRDTGRSRIDILLDVLADEVAARLQARSELKKTESPPVSPQPIPPPPPVSVSVAPKATAEIPRETNAAPKVEPVPPPEPESTAESVPKLGVNSSHAAALMARLAIGLLIIVVLINIPFNTQGQALARSIPSSAALVIANGLLIKESNSPDVYVYRDNAFHWITSLEAFERLGYRWEDVHIVEPGFLNQFPKGNPVSILAKCDASPHVYQLEAGHKRWIVDIPTFVAQGYVWQDVQMVSCDYLHNLPDGDSIPPGRGTPPPPLP